MTPDLKLLAERRTPRNTPSKTVASPATPSRLGTSQIKTIESKLAEECVCPSHRRASSTLTRLRRRSHRSKLLEHATLKADRLSKLLAEQRLS